MIISVRCVPARPDRIVRKIIIIMGSYNPNEAVAWQQLGASINAATANIASVSETKEGRKWQEKMWNKQNEYAEEMYNKYNSPSAQVQQLQSAGLNPYARASSNPLNVSSSVPTPFQSKDSYVANTLALENLLLDRNKALADVKKTEAETRALDNENNMFLATYNDAVKMTNELLKEKQLSNETANFMNQLTKDAYFNEDGSIKDNPHTIDLTSKKLQNTILGVEEKRLKYEENISNLFGVKYHILPEDIKWKIDHALYLYMTDPEGYPIEHTRQSVFEDIGEATRQIRQKRNKEAYEFLHILDELEDGFDKAMEYFNRLPDPVKSKFFSIIAGI